MTGLLLLDVDGPLHPYAARRTRRGGRWRGSTTSTTSTRAGRSSRRTGQGLGSAHLAAVREWRSNGKRVRGRRQPT
ncbi:hypothetical protein [Actinophytocola algeriensis]|uniref:hypothetical protein n=1 Tax=Actinophytocola algeriensis TaxID=1768010 RepID=UPI0016102BFA|nr:hypothetical protein [Actinophytocola algeriensis]MBE1478446.1 hypothetical protein [Actinophytocola algeriensis]